MTRREQALKLQLEIMQDVTDLLVSIQQDAPVEVSTQLIADYSLKLAELTSLVGDEK